MSNLALAEYNLNPVLADWVADAYQDTTENLTNWITGGLGGAKTRGAAQWHILNCFRNYRSKVSWAIAPTFPKADSILVPTFIESLSSDFGLVEGKDFKVTGKNPTIIRLLLTGQTIKFQSANKWRMFIGDNISHFIATEVGFYESREWLAKVWTRARCPKATIHQGLGEGTPEGNNWFQELADFDPFEGPADPDQLFRRYIVETEDNPHLPPGYVENLYRQFKHDKRKLQSYIKGLFVAFTKGDAYWEWFDSRNSKLDVAPSKYLDIGFTWDFQRSPTSWIAFQEQPHKFGRHEGSREVALAESSGKAKGTADSCVEFATHFEPHIYGNTPICLYGGHDGYHEGLDDEGSAFERIKRTLNTLGFRNVRIVADRTSPRIRDRYEKVNELLSYERYVVAAWCRNLIKSHQETEFKPNSWTPKKHAEAIKDLTHFGDAAGYYLFQKYKNTDLEDLRPKTIHKVYTQI